MQVVQRVLTTESSADPFKGFSPSLTHVRSLGKATSSLKTWQRCCRHWLFLYHPPHVYTFTGATWGPWLLPGGSDQRKTRCSPHGKESESYSVDVSP